MKKLIKIPTQIKLKVEFFEGFGMEELLKTIIVLGISSVIGYILYLITKTTLIATLFVIASVVITVVFVTKNRNGFSMLDSIISMKEVISIKKNKSINEFLNIKNIEENFLYTLDEQVILFIRINPINTNLFSEEELEIKMNSMSIEFCNEQYPYTVFIIPRKVDITDYIKEQEVLKRKLQDETSINIVEKRILETHQLVANKNIIENEFYLLIWDNDSEDIKEKLNKRANTWMKRFKNCEFQTRILNKSEIILLVKSFTIPEFARKEDTNYDDSIVTIRRKVVRN